MKFATKPIRQYPPHLRHVATLPWEISYKFKFSADLEENKQIAFLITSNFVIHPQILIFLVFTIASLSPYYCK